MIIIVIISFALDFSVGEVTLRTYLELLFYYLAICSHINWYFWFLLTFIIGNVNSSVGFFFAWVNCFCMSWQTCIREQNRPGICQQAHRWTKSIAMRFEHFCAVSNKCLSGLLVSGPEVSSTLQKEKELPSNLWTSLGCWSGLQCVGRLCSRCGLPGEARGWRAAALELQWGWMAGTVLLSVPLVSQEFWCFLCR